MKKLALLLFVLISFSTTYAAEKSTSKIMEPFKKYEFTDGSSFEYSSYLKQFVGDTIVMEFSPTAYLGSFTVETPDTVWIKKRPKKNPELGKHLCSEQSLQRCCGLTNKFVTPATAINGKPFAVYSVTTQSSYSLNCTIRLLDLENLDIVNFVLYENFHEDFKFTSAKTQRLIKSLEGQNVYYCPDMSSYSSSSRTFTECTYLNGDFYFEVTKSSGMYSHYTFKPYAQIRIKDLDGNVHSFSPIKKPSYSSTKPIIISQNEYETNYKVQYIETDVDTSILQEDIDFPFSFVCIFAQPSHYASVYQKIRSVFNNSK